MARIKRAVFGVLIASVLCGCTCALAGCTKAKAEPETDREQRFDVEFYDSHGDPVHLDHLVVEMVTDRETGRQWMVVCTSHGVALAPLDGGQDGTVSE